jgi:hypothetical protein
MGHRVAHDQESSESLGPLTKNLSNQLSKFSDLGNPSCIKVKDSHNFLIQAISTTNMTKSMNQVCKLAAKKGITPSQTESGSTLNAHYLPLARCRTRHLLSSRNQ